MSIITVPAGLVTPAECTISQARYDLTESSDSTGSESARLLGPPRWRMSLRSPPVMTLAQAGQWEAMSLQMRGRVNHLAMYDPVRTQPQGTLRGTPTLSATAAAGATSLSLTGATGTNLLLGGGFEFDTNVDGISDNWEDYHSGLGSAYVFSRPVGWYGTWAQVLYVTEFASNALGFISTGFAPASPGLTYTLSASNFANLSSANFSLYIEWFDTINTSLGAVSSTLACAVGSPIQRTLTATAPANTVKARVILYFTGLNATTYSFETDNVQFELGSTATTFERGATLKAGDWLQLGSGLGTSQLVKVMADADGIDGTYLPVTIEPPLRQTFASGTAVTWNKPVAHYRQTSEPQWAYRTGRAYKQGQFALDLLESWA